VKQQIAGDNRTLLQNVQLFSVLDDAHIEQLARVVVRRSVAKGRTVLVAGDTTHSLYLILSGRTKVQMSDSEGKEVILAVLGPGEFFGEMGLIDDQPRSATIVTLEACEFLTINKEDFRLCLAANAEMSMLIMRALVKRLREADRKIESLALLDVYGRVARVLLEFSEIKDGVRVLRDKLPRQDVAKMIGASREMVSRVMKGLETDGFLVPQTDGSFILHESRYAHL
jgi:CRP/FNR family cyclic AMP-dependent transcriptional regulator